jgi:hypothetical protein
MKGILKSLHPMNARFASLLKFYKDSLAIYPLKNSLIAFKPL